MMLVPFLLLQWALLGLAPINKDIVVTYGQYIMQVVSNTEEVEALLCLLNYFK